MKKNLLQRSWIWLVAVALISAIILMTGENPLSVLKILLISSFGSFENFSYTLFYMTPLLLTGVSVQLALEAGLFNIGAEGQLYFGALFAVLWGVFAGKVMGPMAGFGSKLFFLGFGLVLSFLGGAFWGGLAGWLKAYRKTHEVIATIMLNFVAMAFVNWVILNPLKNPEIQYPETLWIPEWLRVPKLWQQATPSLFLALIAAFAVLWLIHKTWWGFQYRAAGKNPVAAALAGGVPTARFTWQSMALSGGVAGLVGFHEVFCHSYRLIDGFSPGFGFTGLAIALLSGGKLHRLVLASLLFGALHKGALDLDIETERITRDLSGVIQAFILVALAAYLAIQKQQGPKREQS